jgi:hypothetical protein
LQLELYRNHTIVGSYKLFVTDLSVFKELGKAEAAEPANSAMKMGSVINLRRALTD